MMDRKYFNKMQICVFCTVTAFFFINISVVDCANETQSCPAPDQCNCVEVSATETNKTIWNISCSGELIDLQFDPTNDTIQILDLSNTGLTVISNYMFDNLSEVNTLILANNNLSSIQNNAFQGIATNVHVIDLSYNNLQNIPYKAIAMMKTLHELHLQYNRIRFEGTQQTFLNFSLPTLHTLNISKNNLTSIYDDVFVTFPNLQVLDVSENAISDLHAFDNISTYLQVLSASRNQLTGRVLGFIAKMPSIEVLDLSSNPLGNVTTDFLEIENSTIVEVHLDDCGLDSISTLSFSKHSFLEIVSLSKNNISNFTILLDAFKTPKDNTTNSNFSLPWKQLNLHSNQLNEVPSGLHYLTLIQVLDLSSNAITYLNFPHLEKLNTLDLSDNLIEKISNTSFGNLENLEYLYLKSNRIQSVAIHSFDSLINLKVLDLAENSLQFLGGRTLMPLTSLTRLSLRENMLSESSSDAFQGLASLKILDLSSNNFTFISLQLMQMIPQLQYIDYHVNPLICNCSMNWLVTMESLATENAVCTIYNVAMSNNSNVTVTNTTTLEGYVSTNNCTYHYIETTTRQSTTNTTVTFSNETVTLPNTENTTAAFSNETVTLPNTENTTLISHVTNTTQNMTYNVTYVTNETYTGTTIMENTTVHINFTSTELYNSTEQNNLTTLSTTASPTIMSRTVMKSTMLSTSVSTDISTTVAIVTTASSGDAIKIVGGVFGGFIVITLLLVLLICCKKYRTRSYIGDTSSTINIETPRKNDNREYNNRRGRMSRPNLYDSFELHPSRYSRSSNGGRSPRR